MCQLPEFVEELKWGFLLGIHVIPEELSLELSKFLWFMIILYFMNSFYW